MMDRNCRCPHHKLEMLLGLLTWVAAVLFLWTAWRGTLVWGFGAAAYFDHVIVFALLKMGFRGMCKCCGRGKMMGCSCKCGNCEGGKCDSRHGEGHQNM